MGAGEVHYEVFVRRVVGQDWTLESATPDRGQAIATAETLLAEHRAAAVKVCKETLNPSSGRYASLDILTRGDLRGPRSTAQAERDDGGLLCVAPADLYSLHARERIERLFDGWLTRQQATPFELLHRADLVERLDASGLEIQHALQKVSIPEAQSRHCSVHEVIRRYRKLADDAVARVLGDHRRGVFPDLSVIGFPAAVQVAFAAESPRYVLGGAVAAAMAPATTWVAKVERLLDLADAAPVEGAARALAFRVLEQPLGEILGSRRGLAALMGEASPDLGASVAMMTRLAAPDVVEALIQGDGIANDQFPSVPEAVNRLAGWVADPAFATVRAALARRILAELKGHRRLHPDDPEREIQAMRTIARALVLAGPRLIDPQDVQAAFLDRSRGLLNADFIQLYLDQAGGGPLEEAHALVRLAENVVGSAAKLAAARWLKAVVFSLRFERTLTEGSDTPTHKLAHLAELCRALQRAGLTVEDRTELAVKVGEIGGVVEAEARLVHAIAHAAIAAPQRLMLLLKLAAGESAPQGPVCARARAEALRLVRDPAVRSQLAAAPELAARVHDLFAAPSAASA